MDPLLSGLLNVYSSFFRGCGGTGITVEVLKRVYSGLDGKDSIDFGGNFLKYCVPYHMQL